MGIQLIVPSFGESVSEALISEWLVNVGDTVKQDQPLCAFESDKVNSELPSPVTGVLVSILRKTGETVNVGEVIGEIEEKNATETAEEKTQELKGAAVESNIVSKINNNDQSSSTKIETTTTNQAPLSPSVKRMVEEENINHNLITATGPKGRLTKGDVIDYIEKRGENNESKNIITASKKEETKSNTTLNASLNSINTNARAENRIKMSPLRKKVAERLVSIQQTAAILTTFNEVDMSAIMALRAKYQDKFVEKYGIKLGFMSFFVKATIDALKAYPGVNSEIQGDEIVYKYYYDVGVAVGGGKGLVVPVIKNAERQSLAELEKSIATYGKKAKENKLSMDELTGGTFTISNGGVYGSLMSTPIINPPQTAILGMHKIMDRPMALDGQVVIRPMMYLALSYDHRVIDGREAVGFLVRVKECIEHPERMLLEV